MYVGRDFTELSMTPKTKWSNKELLHFHHSFQQIMPYLNPEGATIYREILEEIGNRDDIKRNEASWEHGTRINYD
ncbi:hypothetical protein ACFPU1_10795 [Thalassorhabdus alkalitolerans]|uniref:Cytosolic protein n=1 Tax=Thalassorhabdus alkalitolerans TaxID=2282697 RepID=A0ABW0YLG0_9BACI|nr:MULTISPECIES: hypothetical protein [Bacillaceae]